MKALAVTPLLLTLFLAPVPGSPAADDNAAIETERLASPAVQRRLRVLERDLEDGLLTRAEFEGRRKALLSAEAPAPTTAPAPVPVSRGALLGVAVRNLEDPDRELLRAREGALVMEVVRDGPAASAGLRAGDVITRANGQAVPTAAALIALIAGLEPGARLTLGMTRRWQPVEAEVILGRVPSSGTR